MSLKKLFLHGAALFACLLQSACETGGPPVDLRNPSVAELDAADVRWGLPPRKAKGAPKRTLQYQMDDSGSHGGSGAVAAPAPAAASGGSSPAPAPEPIPAKPDPALEVSSKLR